MRKIRYAIGGVCLCAMLAVGALSQKTGDGKIHYTSGKHIAKGMDCTACHDGDGPKKPVTGEKCLSCHQSFDEVAKRTQDMDPNPHDNHQTLQNISCTECHKGHTKDVVFCQQCHGDMKLVRNSKKN